MRRIKASNSDAVLVIAEKSDIHADAVIYYLEKKGVTVFRLDLPQTEGWKDSPSVEWTPGIKDEDAILQWKGRCIIASSIRSVYCRDLDFR